MARVLVPVEALTREAFAPFGDVIEIEGSHHYPINGGYAERFHDLARIDVLEGGGRPLVNVFRATPWPNPIRLKEMERHPFSSQAFMPLSRTPFLAVVAAPGAEPVPENLRAFISNGRQGVNYGRGTWHHPLLALEPQCDFLVVDRGGAGDNCDVVPLADDVLLALRPDDSRARDAAERAGAAAAFAEATTQA